MNMAAQKPQNLIDRLPAARGLYEQDAPLADLTWFRVGGPAEILYRPADEDDLAGFLRTRPIDVPVTVIGVGSNLLVRDGGIPGIVVRLSRTFARASVDGETVIAGAAAPDVSVALACRDAGLGGLEFLRGVPGTIGGALKMNAGAYGREIRDVLVSARALDGAGEIHVVDATALGLSYRHSQTPDDWIFTSATLRGVPAAPAEIAARMTEVGDARAESQPVKSRTGGSTFKNPAGFKAWELVDQAGCRGLRLGGAMVSEQHCNFLINTGGASAADIEALGEEVRRRVRASAGVDLDWEIRRLGVPS
jgi:UDP-N-acetylmuramate dehydrogenase